MKNLNHTAKPKVLIIGIDGATFDLIKPWAEEGKLPTFKRLIDEGVHGELESVIPPITPPAWTSLMTGMNPGKHGLFNFIKSNHKDYSIRYTSASDRKVHTIWRLLNDNGWTVGVMNVPMTYPPEEVNGYCISGMDTPDSNSKFVYPQWLKKEIEDEVGEIFLDLRHLGYMKTDDKRRSTLDALVKIENRRTEIAEYLIKKHPVDVMMLVYTATDTVQHFFWNYMDPTHYLYDPAEALKYGDAILNIYAMIDSNIARLLSVIPNDCTVMLVSDHGSGPVSHHIIYLNQYLEELGLLTYKKKSNGNAHYFNRLFTGLDDYFRSILSPAQKVWLSKAFPVLRERWEAYANFAEMIDWQKTKAYCFEYLSFPSEIWINLKGRMPNGIVESGAEYEALIRFLMDKLYDLKDNKTGQRLIHRIYRKEEILKGPHIDSAPDLVLTWWEGNSFQVRKSVPGANHPCVLEYASHTKVEPAAWSGTHRLNGIFLARGDAFRSGGRLVKAHITDITPTLLYFLGVPVSLEMDGRALVEAFTEEFAASHPLQYNHTELQPVNSSGFSYSQAETEKIEERLRGLGYID